jgi:hypothetical protein
MMSVFLLDVNVLIALLDPAHVHHDAAHDWFAATKDSGWATCPITENAVIRILSNPSYPSVDFLPNDAMDHLTQFFTSATAHTFWADDVRVQDESVFDRRFIRGHKQITDIYLAGLAHHHGGRMATFDQTIPYQAIREAGPDILEVLPV